MPKRTALEAVVEKAIRKTMDELTTLEPGVRMQALKIATDFLKFQKVSEAGHFGGAFTEDPSDEP